MFPKMFRKFKKISLFFIVLSLWGQDVQAAFEPRPLGAWQRALGNAGLASVYSGFAAYNNPALLAGGGGPAVSLLYQNFFGLADLNQIALSVAAPLYGLDMGLDVLRLGNATYSETTFSAAAAMRLTPSLVLGVGVNSYLLEIKNYGRDVAFGLQLALRYQLSEGLEMAVVAANVNEPVIGRAREALPVFGRAGLLWRPVEQVTLFADALYEQEWDAFFGLGYRLNDHLSLMTGTQSLNNSFSAGFLLSLDNIRLGYALEVHPELNYSHTVDIRYEF